MPCGCFCLPGPWERESAWGEERKVGYSGAMCVAEEGVAKINRETDMHIILRQVFSLGDNTCVLQIFLDDSLKMEILIRK